MSLKKSATLFVSLFFISSFAFAEGVSIATVDPQKISEEALAIKSIKNKLKEKQRRLLLLQRNKK